MNHLATQLVHFGPIGVFVGMVLESAGLPVPSEVVLPFAGWLTAGGSQSFWLLFVLAIAGQLVGAFIGYGIGYFGGRPATLAYERYTGHRHLEAAEKWFARHGSMAVFWARFLPVVRTYIPWPAGIGHMDLRRFALLTVLGSVPWTLALMLAGRLLGQNWDVISHDFSRAAEVIVVLIVIAIAILLIRKKRAGSASS